MADTSDENSSKATPFEQALSQLDSYGTPGAVAAFQIGWDVEHLRQWKPLVDRQGSDQESREWAARRILHVESALGELRDTLTAKGLSIDTTGLLTAVVNEEYKETLTATGGQLPYKWAITGSLPNGLGFDEGSGLISGTPALVTTSAVRVQVQDAAGVTTSAWLTLVVSETSDLFAPASYPSTTPLRLHLASVPDAAAGGGDAAKERADAVTKFAGAVDAFGRQMWRALVVARASAPLTETSGGAQQPGTASAATMAGAYELGTELARVTLHAESAGTEKDLRAAFSLVGGGPAGLAHARASRLRGAFPSGAAYAVTRHLEDWSAWVNGSTLDWTVPPSKPEGGRKSGPAGSSVRVTYEDWHPAVTAQGKIWESLLTGQSLAKDYVVAASYADAADHLVVTWSLVAASVARSLRRTALGKIVLILLACAVVVIIGALVYSFGLTPAVRQTNTTGPDVATLAVVLVGALGGGAGLVHYARAHVAAVTGKAWALAESPLANAEMLEAIAIATRRLPGEDSGGGAGGGHRTFEGRLKRAKTGALAPRHSPRWFIEPKPGPSVGADSHVTTVPAMDGTRIPNPAGTPPPPKASAISSSAL